MFVYSEKWKMKNENINNNNYDKIVKLIKHTLITS